MSRTKKTDGISKDFYDVNKIMKNLLDEDEIDQMEQLTVHVDQFSWRNTSGRDFNIIPFFNSGLLPANIALQQLFYCVMYCECVGSRVMGFICNAAGSMQRLFKYLCQKKELTEGAWLTIDLVRSVNPYDKLNWIFTYHCGTHNLKKLRSQVWLSKPDGSNFFFDVDRNFIGKTIFVEAWLRDEACADLNILRETEIKQGAIELDK